MAIGIGIAIGAKRDWEKFWKTEIQCRKKKKTNSQAELYCFEWYLIKEAIIMIKTWLIMKLQVRIFRSVSDYFVSKSCIVACTHSHTHTHLPALTTSRDIAKTLTALCHISTAWCWGSATDWLTTIWAHFRQGHRMIASYCICCMCVCVCMF